MIATSKHAQETAQHRPAPAAQPGAAQHDGGQHLQLAPDQRVGHDFLGDMCLHQPADPGHHPAPAKGNRLHQPDGNPRPPRAFGVVAKGVKLPPGRGAPDQHPGRQPWRTAITATGRISSAQVPLAVWYSHRITRCDHQAGRL